MLKNKTEKKDPIDYKEPYEFRLLIGDSIICQRYFKINNFNQTSLTSMELTDTIRMCANMINEDLKSKTRVYTWYMAPLVFDDVDEMYAWFSNPEHSKVRAFENIFLRNENSKEYLWDGEKLIEFDKKINDGTFTAPLSDKDTLTYELAFYVNEKKIVSTIFDGVYPYYIRRNIDLSNTRGKFEGEDMTRVSFENYILNRLVSGRQDLIKKVVKEICYTCSMSDNSSYTQIETFVKPNGEKVDYALNFNDAKFINSKYAKEIDRAKQYLYGSSKSK